MSLFGKHRQHMTMIGSDPTGRLWRVTCTCGWESENVANIKAARDAADTHLIIKEAK